MPDLNAALEALYFAHRALIARPDAILARYDLSRGHHRILFFIARTPGLSVNELLAKLDVCKQSVNAPLRKLIEVGFVKAEPDKNDKRIKRLVLTKRGAALEEELTEDQRARLARAFAAVGKNSDKAWFNIMHELTQQ